MTVSHGTFTIDRVYPASLERVFAAWATPSSKQRWFACHDDWVQSEYSLDFRVGGREHLVSTPPGEPPHVYDAWYHEIVDRERIIYAYEMHLGTIRVSVSLATVELSRDGERTRLRFTEQVAILDGSSLAEREAGTAIGLDNLGVLLRE